jgi:hypothetical protein
MLSCFFSACTRFQWTERLSHYGIVLLSNVAIPDPDQVGSASFSQAGIDTQSEKIVLLKQNFLIAQQFMFV